MICHRCQKDVHPVYSKSGPHIRADCPVCQKYIKFIPLKNKDEWVMPFGKYKDVKLKDINDRSYLEWLLENVEVGNRMRTLIEEKLNNDKK